MRMMSSKGALRTPPPPPDPESLAMAKWRQAYGTPSVDDVWRLREDEQERRNKKRAASWAVRRSIVREPVEDAKFVDFPGFFDMTPGAFNYMHGRPVGSFEAQPVSLDENAGIPTGT